MEKFIRFDFTEQDILDSFDLFMENYHFKKKEYYLEEIVDEFLHYIYKDIMEAYDKKNSYKCKRYIKNKLLNNAEYLYNKYGK